MTAYYNEFDPKAAAWLRELIKAGLIADGIVDERSIEDVRPDELKEYTQCHFFAGIGGWSLALRLAGWPDDKPVWTGSCPCQPFSSAGKGAGFADERHLWPAFHYLIEQCRPPVVFGEQVASKDGLAWLDLVQADLEGTGYAVGAADLCAAGIGAPHIRQRLWFVGHAIEQGLEGHGRNGDHGDEPGRIDAQQGGSTAQAGATGGMADYISIRHADIQRGSNCHMVAGRNETQPLHGFEFGGTDASKQSEASPTNGLWRDADWLFCRDGKWRPVEARAQPLVDGLPESLGRVRDESADKIEKEVIRYAEATQTRPELVVRNLWDSISAQEERERKTGRVEGLLPPALLLAFMCQLAAQGRNFSENLPLLRQEDAKGNVRMLRNSVEIAGAPYQRGLVGQQTGEHTNAMRELSYILACVAQKDWQEAIAADAEIGFPLGHNSLNRVMRLKGYGNAIVPEDAAEVIGSYMEIFNQE